MANRIKSLNYLVFVNKIKEANTTVTAAKVNL